ncbi:MAG: pilus assembly protein PilM [Candidatus Hydrogenedentes bacterium]|nr:pilus assembly protein PilM [Candidatus Hydrogenedentota bacterium]
MARKPETLCILQAGAAGAAWWRFELTPSGATPLSSGTLRGEFQEDEALAAALKSLADEQGLRGDRLLSVLPRHDLTTRILTLPTHDSAEIASMLRFSAEEFVPFSAGELIIDHAVLRGMPSGESVVFAVLAHQDIVNRHLALLAAAGLEPEQILLSTACLVSAAAARGVSGTNRYAVVYLVPGGLEIAVLDRERLVYSRGTQSAQDWEALARNPEAVEGGGLLAESGAEELAAEIRGTLSAYRRESEDGEGVEVVFFAANGGDLSPLCAAVGGALGRECLPFPPVAGDRGDAVLLAEGACLTARGLAPVVISLLPERLVEKRKALGARRLALHVAVFAGLVLLGLGLLQWQAFSQRGKVLGEFRSKLMQMAPNAEGIREKREQLGILRRQVDHKGSIIEQLATVVDAVPADRANITRINLDRQAGISLWGRAKSVNDVAEFAQSLRNKAAAEALAFFSHAHSLYEQQVDERGQQVFSYQIEVPLTDDKEEEDGGL